MERWAQAGLVLPCWLQLIHRKQETETEVLLKNTSCFPGSPWEGGRADGGWNTEIRTGHL